ncbi:glutamyl-tRNA(Gln) amidotransferase subunit B, mitochondrial-like isoform X2 [Tachypleus tridentatus]|uniref:glutamyl-tRNA(Gln) amidotransferase subunit B, mitochondrial-like isoform X2 n=1 Tax=Tachypleus tridentatus TaxID=6853 RepID=UPI003FCF0BB2
MAVFISQQCLCNFCSRQAIKYVNYSRIFKNNSDRKLHVSSYFSTGRQAKRSWESVVGLEIHAQINSEAKMFSGAGTQFTAAPNTQVSLFDAALPGTLPVLNRRCVEAGVLTALALNCTVHKVSMFDRKHYFYADLPAGYQITQQRMPLATNGFLSFVVFNPVVHKRPYKKTVGLLQLQLEQDSGKSLHDVDEGRTLIDLNRAGVPLMELVFEATLKDGEEAAALVKELQLIFKRLGTCTSKMEEGALRVDANVSVNQPGEPWGTRTEVKNINSVRCVAKAVDFEIKRQIGELEAGFKIINETRMFDAQAKQTVPMRDKEVFQDYRYMPEPNLPPLRLSDSKDGKSTHLVSITDLQDNLCELPGQARQRLIESYGISLQQAMVIVSETGLEEFYCAVLNDRKRNVKIATNFILSEVMSQLNDKGLTFGESPVSPQKIGDLLDMLESKFISLATAQDVLKHLFEDHAKSPQEVKQFKKGKERALNPLLAEVRVSSLNRADMAKAKKIIIKLLKERN